jgi:3-phenylpropionate/trans-cinnamate dioxygenase ferredoxin reductase subunit
VRRIVIVGASAAGLTVAETLRREGFAGEITMVGDEPHLPYDRPPLSKQVLSGVWEPERVQLREKIFYPQNDIQLRLGTAATGLDTEAHEVLLGDKRIEYDKVVIATGVQPRQLPGHNTGGGLHVVRTVDDAIRLRRAFDKPATFVVIGAGFLGCEAAASARKQGLDVTLVDPLPHPMVRQFGPYVGNLIAELHMAQGVKVETSVPVDYVESDWTDRVTGVKLHNGTTIPADLVLVAIGATPATDWLAGSNVPVDNGVLCDEYLMAAPDVYAAGDVASWHHRKFGQRMRVEHRMNATEQGMAVARNLLGAETPFEPIPYFWTDQFDEKLAAFGLLGADAEVTIEHGDPADNKFIAHYRHNGELTGVFGWNMNRDLRKERKLLVED